LKSSVAYIGFAQRFYANWYFRSPAGAWALL